MIDYAKDLRIDPNALEYEWLRQPMLMVNYTKASATALLEKNKAKERLDLIEAELDYKIRSEHSLLGIDKAKAPTETAIKNWIRSREEYLVKLHEYQEADYHYNIISGAVSALYAKKTALEYLVKLFLRNYYAEPKLHDDLREEARQFNQEMQNQFLNREE